MHPFVARIRPSYRTAALAWLLSRVLCWGVSLRAGWGSLPLLHAPAYGEGAPGWAGFVRLCRALDAHRIWFETGAGTASMVAAGELALLVAAVAVYRYVRAEDLPQTAERTTWLWMLMPVMAWTLPVSSWNFAAAGVAVGLVAARRRYFWAAGFAVAAAAVFRAEAILVWPGLVWMAFARYRAEKDAISGLWAAIVVPLAGFTATVGGAMLAAGRWGMSVRTLHPAASWRSSWAWHGWRAEAPTLLVGLAVVVGLALLVRAVRRDRGAALVAAGPALVWPLLHRPVADACGVLLLAIPAFAVLARRLGDVSRERVAMVASLGGLLVILV